MKRVLIVDNDRRDGERYSKALASEHLAAEVYEDGASALASLGVVETVCAVFILWEIPGTPSGFDLLARCRQACPHIPVVVLTGTLDVALAARAVALGARDFLEKPLDAERLKDCLRRLLAEQDPLSPLVVAMRETIVGNSPALLNSLYEIAKVIPQDSLRVLIVGESGTGKELVAREIHRLGSRSRAPWMAVNFSAIPKDLIESHLFGHEAGAFTGARGRHVGYLEESGDGVLFLDEIGEVPQPLQVKLLRVFEEQKFRRIGGGETIEFRARLVTATNRDLAVDVRQGVFRQDLYHRIAQTTIRLPSLRERQDDIDTLLDHYLSAARPSNDASVGFSREARTILRSYPFPGNIRELLNVVQAAIAQCSGRVILPTDLPLPEMGVLIGAGKVEHHEDVDCPAEWFTIPYKDGREKAVQAFDRAALKLLLERAHYSVSKAALEAGIDDKTFRKRWKESGLPPLTDVGEKTDG